MILAVVNQKGGVGKTTTSVNLSAALSGLGYEVLLIDMDPQGNATMACRIVPQDLQGRSTYHVLMEGVKTEDAIITPYIDEGLSLGVIGSNRELSGAEIELVQVKKREFFLKDALASVKKKYDYILLDCPPTLSLLTLNTLCAAERVIIPMQCEFYALSGVTDLVATLRRVRRGLNPTLEIEGLLRTMYDSRNALAAQVSDQIFEYFGDKVFQTVIPRNVRLAEAPSFGLPCTLYEPSCRGSQAYLACAEELVKRLNQFVTHDSSLKRIKEEA